MSGELSHTSQKNNFLSPREAEKRKYAYWGEFLVLENFDDGWSEIMFEEFKKYVERIKESGIDIELFQEKEDVLGKINIILKSQIINEDKEEKILGITKKLQEIFLLTVIDYKPNYSLVKDTKLPFRAEKLDAKDNGYERQAFQTMYAKMLFLNSELERLNYHIGILEDSNQDNALEQLLVHQKEIQVGIKLKIEQIKQDLPDLQALLYHNLSLKNLGNFNESNLIDIEKILNPEKPEVSDNKQENLEQIEKDENIDITRFSKGAIGKCNLDKDGGILSAIGLKKGEQIYHKDGETFGFYFEGIPDISGINVLNINEAGEVTFLKVISNESNYYFYLENGNYKKFEIFGEKIILEITEFQLDESGIPMSGKLKFKFKEYSSYSLFWKENGEYESFSLAKEHNINYFEDFEVNNEGKPLYGSFSLTNSNSIMFWLEDGEYKILNKIEGFDNNIYYFHNAEINNFGKPLYGLCKINGKELAINFILDTKTGKYRKKRIFERNPYKKDNLLEFKS